jgi:hypothetical protein
MVPWVIFEFGNVPGVICRSHGKKAFWGIICIDGVFRRKEDVKEEIEYSFWRDSPYIAN